MTLVERLREMASVRTSALFSQRKTLNEAADEIERLEKAMETAREDAIEEAAVTVEKARRFREWKPIYSGALEQAAKAVRHLSQKKEG